MIDNDALNTLQANFSSAQVNRVLTDKDLSVVQLHKDYKLVDIERYLAQPDRFTGDYSTADFNSFIAYCNTHIDPQKNAACFIDPSQMRARVVFDFGSPEDPRHHDHAADLHLKRNASYASLCQHNDNYTDQRAAAEWIEDWTALLRFSVDGTALGNSDALAAIKGLDIKKMQSHYSEIAPLSESRSMLESVEVKSPSANPPDLFTLTDSLYHDLPPQSVDCRLRYKSDDKGKVLVKYTCARFESVELETADHFQIKIRAALDTAIASYIGFFRQDDKR